ncbi:hypothetical protein TrVE_jg187 [Triparma verrucosa]|uniref:DOT1 domain-containing protein n=1 Tax=Triparma verrucosa TaxID=1606542 RepID=A0A9W7B6H9_9STRA|nr:hypothetical protein TrVE_jg187 [Triparma verrucosa]
MERLIPLLEPYLSLSTTTTTTTTTTDPQFVDIGSGDGRVCVTVSKHFTCHSLGIDVTDLCTNRAKQLSVEEKTSHLTTFLTLDATALKLDSDECGPLKCARIVYLFVFPSLLKEIKKILKEVMSVNEGLRVVTQNYHFEDDEGEIEAEVEVEDDGFKGLKIWKRLY